MKFLAPWYETKDEALVAELHRELPEGHVLHGKPVKAMGRREDRDQALFALQDGTGRLAVVHLTFQVETDVSWPRFSMFGSEAEWIERMEVDHGEFEA
ncbi:hypothetical protein [Hydrogenophaga sp. 5NK40-0174]|uniref:hypothetical protein n=1 Tax=Hydrogenophaga sp. 5NK40-0174 TaxID=3127649 RepID=UPI003103586D